ncbi:biofilm regulation phosphoprotein SiaC [Solimonas flava]|uniref:biofilm regulation phosphoprotein SiaC n=1 Tax=Solimonas flava TaxID=415849 RepID=UPI0003F99912|nr:biofilm regulation phosphoprotein SiaC [Solimonas flava]
MTNIEIAATQSTPAISADAGAGRLTMRGDSYPENSFAFFAPIIEWAERRLAETGALAVDLYLLYLNTSSVKAMMDLFDLLEAAHRAGRRVSVHWYYDQQNLRVAELAEEFKEDCSFAFEIIAEPTAG